MSATIHYSLKADPSLLDVVDEAWAADCLPVDDVPLPDSVAPPSDEADVLADQADAKGQEDKWGDLGLHPVH